MAIGNTTGLDDRDVALAMERFAKFNKRNGPRVGDFVRFGDGTLRRISYHWHDDDGGVQTSDGGSFYFGDGFCSMSGPLFPSVPTESLALTDERRAGTVWFFHHDIHQAHNGVTLEIQFRVYCCSLDAPR